MDYRRSVLECGQCRGRFAPADRLLGVKPRQHLSLGVQRKLARLGARMDYTACAEDLENLIGVRVSAKEAQLVTRQAGAHALELLDEQMQQWSALQRPEAPVVEQKPHQAVVLEMDGTCVMGRDGQGHEVKVATVFGLDERGETSSGRALLSERLWYATGQDIEQFKPYVYALATRWGGREAARMAILADGAHWIWNFAKDRFAHAVCILDFWHASEHLHELSQALFNDKQWAHDWSQRLRQGEVPALLSELERLRQECTCDTKRKLIAEQQTYFTNNQDRMDYPSYEAAGWPIGSGAVEGACKNLIKERMAGAGQRWSQEGIEQMAALRTVLFNKDWDELCSKMAA